MSKRIKMISPEGVTLKTAGKYIKEDIYISNDLPAYNGENEGAAIVIDEVTIFDGITDDKVETIIPIQKNYYRNTFIGDAEIIE